MAYIEIALPGTLLLAKFMLKLFVDRSVKLPDVYSAILALPVDIVFLAASLLAGHAIVATTNIRDGLIHFTLCIVIAILIVAFWRKSDSFFNTDHIAWSAVLGLLNIGLSFTTLLVAVNLLQGAK